MPSRRRLALFLLLQLSICASTASAQSAPVPAKLPPDTIVARQGPAVLTLTDIDAFAQRMDEKQRAGFFNSPKRLEALVMNLLMQRQLASEAEKAGLDKDASVLAQMKLSNEEILSRARVEQMRSGQKLPNFDALAREEYVAHKEKYVKPGKLDVKHILIATGKHSDDEAKKLAEDVRKQAAEHPDDFDALVEKYSEDPSKAQNHGLMTDAKSKKYVPQFSAAAGALKAPGEISPIVKTKFGYHVLKLVARTSDEPQTFEQVKAAIVEDLRSTYINKEVNKHTDELRNQPIDAKPDVIASLRDRYGSRQTPDELEATSVPDSKTP